MLRSRISRKAELTPNGCSGFRLRSTLLSINGLDIEHSQMCALSEVEMHLNKEFFFKDALKAVLISHRNVKVWLLLVPVNHLTAILYVFEGRQGSLCRN